jgi:hypothetical protein
MSITQTFYLAHKARSKLSNEAARSDHNLRLLVGHANLLDSLMIHISEAEAEQDKWYSSTVRGNEQAWEESEYDNDEEKYGSLPADYDSDSDSSVSDDSDYDLEEALEVASLPSPVEHRFLASNQTTVIGVLEVEEDDLDDDYEDDEDDDSLSLTRTYSHRPPSLCSDSSDDEDESNLPSPEQPTEDWEMHLSQKERIEAASYRYFDSQSHTEAKIIHHGPAEVFLGEPLGLLPEMISSY